jgi:hypothetical protein
MGGSYKRTESSRLAACLGRSSSSSTPPCQCNAMHLEGSPATAPPTSASNNFSRGLRVERICGMLQHATSTAHRPSPLLELEGSGADDGFDRPQRRACACVLDRPKINPETVNTMS